MLAIAIAPLSFSASTADAKQRLKGAFGAPVELLACPTTKSALRYEQSVLGGQARRCLTSAETGARYPDAGAYYDLLPSASTTIDLGGLAAELREALQVDMQTQFFRTPAMAFLYERGWRQNFNAAGFPGIDKEFAEAAEFFAPCADGGVVVDLSCGSGLMTRRLCRSGRYRRVLGLDYSEAMLGETSRRFDAEGAPRDALTLVRADAAQLPLADCAVDGLHAGAALHCWPQLEQSLAEVHRVLKPGGRFYATTFFAGALGVGSGGGGPLGGGGGAAAGLVRGMRFFDDAAELEALLAQAGFAPEDVQVRREGAGCAVIRAEKAAA